MKAFVGYMAVLLGALGVGAAGQPVAVGKPNVIIILADDLGYADVGFQGLGDIPTPNIDRLASDGVRCTSGYVCWTACSPSRAGLVTGQDPHRFGFYDNPNPILAANQGLPPGIMTVPRALQQQGYVTAGIGKWHLGTTPDRHPNRMGFTEWYGFLGGGHEYFPRDTYTTWNKGAKTKYPQRPWPEWFVNQTLPIVRNSDPVKTQRYLTDEFTHEAVDFIKRHPQTPFFLYLSYNAPHSPYEAPADEEALLDVNKMAKVSGVTAAQRRTYAAMITRLDKGVGKLVASLKENGLEEKTAIFFLSDNGGGHSGPGYYSSNDPLRGYKGDLYEGGIRVPFVVTWKGKLPSGSIYKHPVTSLDIGATALALAGGAPAQMKLDGVNLMPYLSGQKEGSLHERVYVKRMGLGVVREGRYKLHTGEGKRVHELYDVESDLGETKNIAAENPELTRRLDAAWQTWNAAMVPPLWKSVPASEWKRPEYQPPLMPDELEDQNK